ncbi:MAG: short-chain dehydrogenase [Candidatus Binatia bacterium]|nr:MAG: short-chain dehydrogenase [Candidatus Binatia bacterium]
MGLLDRFRLDGKVAIVTGAGRGIGRACALAFAEVGAHVACAARTEEQIQDTAARIQQMGRSAIAVRCDVNQRTDLEQLVEATMAEFGRIDILVNNAGGTPPCEALYTSERMFEEAFHFNVTSAFLLTRLAVPHMLRRAGEGVVLNISSAAGRFPLAGFVAYSTAKAALSHMTRVLGQEFAPKVRVNAIAVGATETSALVPFLNDELRAKMEALTPMRRLGTVEDIALAALYLVSPASSWVTGKVFEVDGGTETSNWPFPPPTL